jgi:UDP-N-acetylmuramoyl-tripeptide--D-alanyl-D-alanine ligase
MLAAQAPTSASVASFNNHVGVPISLARLPREARYGVFEIGMNHPGEIAPLARQVEAHVGVITNVGPVHIGHMGSEEAIADEKGCLFAGMAEGAVAVLDRDSHHYDRLAGHARRFGVSRVVGFGRSETAEARLLSCSLQDTGSDVAALIHGRRIEYRLGAAGEHWVLNSIAALAVVEALGANVVEAAATLKGIGASPGRGARRMLKFGAGTVELLDESYNANPVSMRAMLALLARTEPARGGRRLLAMGDMRELGEGADAYHAGLADAVAASGATQVFLCGPHMRALWPLLAPAQRGVHRPDSASLAGDVAAALRAGDVIAVKGSLGSKMKNVVDAIVAASDGEAGR